MQRKWQDSHQEPQRWTRVHKAHKDKDRKRPSAKKRAVEDKGADHRDKAKDLGGGQLVDPESLMKRTKREGLLVD